MFNDNVYSEALKVVAEQVALMLKEDGFEGEELEDKVCEYLGETCSQLEEMVMKKLNI